MELKHQIEGGVPFGYEEMDPAKGQNVTKNKELFLVMPEVRNMNQVVIYNLTASPYQYITLQNRPPSIDFEEKLLGQRLNQWDVILPCTIILVVKI